jgi:hypothetical protein
MKIENEISSIKQSLSRLESRGGFSATLDKLLQLRRLSLQARAARQPQQSQLRVYSRKPQARVYTMKPGSGFRYACAGYDFDSVATLRRMRQRFAECLMRYSNVDAAEAAEFASRFNHSWEIAFHDYDPPTDQPCAWVQIGRACVDGVAWRGVVNPDPNSVSRRLYHNAVQFGESLRAGGFSYKRLKGGRR